MKFRWWIAIFLLVALGLPLQPGCGKKGELPTESSPDGPVDTVDPAQDTEVPAP